MNAKQLIEQTNECVRNHWQNSDLSRRSEIMLGIIAKHFEKCEECRDAFDTEEYTSETLIKFESEMHLNNTNLFDWMCGKFPISVDGEDLKGLNYSGYVRGEYFTGEWLDGSPMKGYGVYTVDRGDVAEYGCFSESGGLQDIKDAGNLIESFREETFEIVQTKEG